MNLKAFAIVLLTTVLLCQITQSVTLRSRKSIVGLAAVGSIQGGQTVSTVQVLNEWCTNLTTHLNTTLEKFVSELYIENTLWKVRAYAIYARVVDESEIERVRFLLHKRRGTFHVVLCLLYIYILRQSSSWRPFYFKSLQNAFGEY